MGTKAVLKVFFPYFFFNWSDRQFVYQILVSGECGRLLAGSLFWREVPGCDLND